MKKQFRKSPLVSVIMPVYNASAYLPAAIESIQKQTYRHLEIICADDCSTDDSRNILKKFARRDKRIRVYHLPTHAGVGTAANAAIRRARGRFIARMDADDVSYPTRIDKQVAFLSAHPEVIAVGAQCRRINERGGTTGIKTFPLDHETISSMLFRSVPIQQPTLMINTRRLPEHFRWYKRTLPIGEDYDLYYQLMQYGKLANLPDILIKYRERRDNLTLSSQKFTFWCIWQSRLIALTRYGYVPDLGSMINVLVQTLLVLLLPERILYPLHLYTRKLFFHTSSLSRV